MSNQLKDYLIAYKVYKPLTKGKIIGIALLVIILALTLGAGYYFFVHLKSPSSAIDENNLEIFMDGDFYLGNQVYTEGTEKTSTFSLKSILGYAESQAVTFESLDSNIAIISGDVVTIKATGELDIKITQDATSKEKTILVVEGVNIFAFEQLFYAIEQEQPVILQADIELADPRVGEYAITPSNGDVFFLKADFYGNGYDVICTEVLNSPYDAAFRIKADNLTIRDTHFFGVKVTEGAKLEDFEQTGAILAVESDFDTYVTGTILKNCILENAHRCVFICSTQITIDGCIIRNASDSTVSVQTNDFAPSNITVKNCIMANSVVSCMTFWCMDNITNPDNFVTVTFEGFLDCYNWKDIDSARIMPRTEPLEPFVRDIISKNMKKPIYQEYYYNYKGASYLHAAIMVISTPPSQGNYPIFVGLESIDYSQREFPFPAAAKSLIKTLNLCGYEDGTTIQPDSKISDNPKLYQELRYGRD